MKVNVLMVTYNHAKFIAEAIQSVMMQQVNFDYELVIGEDCSTDQTRDIVISFKERFPERIRLLLPTKNLGAQRNFEQVLKACTGRYVALLEGDDYWTSNHKLQKQVDFLDANPDCAICCHPVWVYDDARQKARYVWPEDHPEISTIEDLLKSLFFHTSSVVFRNGLFKEYPDWMRTLAMSDWPLHILNANCGKIGLLKDTMGVYRQHSGGIWYSANTARRYEENIKMYNCVNAHFDHEYNGIIRPILAQLYFELAVIYDQSGEFDLARTSIKKCLAARLGGKQKPGLNAVKMLARLAFPSAYHWSKRLIRS